MTNESHVYRVVKLRNVIKQTGLGINEAREVLKSVNWDEELAMEDILRQQTNKSK